MKKELYADKIILDKDWLEYIAKTTRCKYNYLIGSYRSSKTTFNVFAYGCYLNNLEYDALHLCLASSSSVAKTLIEDNAGFGLQDFFCEKYTRGYYKEFECGYIKNSKGYTQTILYMGGTKANSYQMFRGMSLESVMVEEANLMHENTINEIKGRTFAARNPHYFFTQNPSSEKVPSRQWLTDLMNNVPDQVNFARKSIFDNPALSDERIEEIISEYDKNSIFYKRFILGEDCAAEGTIYKLDNDNLFKDINCTNYIDYIIVIDPGKTASATFMLATGRNIINKSLDVLYELHHKNDVKNQARIYISSDYARLAAGFIKDCAEKMGKWPSCVIIDSFPGDDFYETLRKEVIQNRLPITVKFPVKSDGKAGKDEKPAIITRELDLLYRHKLRINSGCTHLIDDLQNATYDQKLLEEKGIETRSDSFNVEGHNDGADCLDYTVSFYGPLMNMPNFRK